MKNLAADNPDVVKELTELQKKYFAEINEQ